MSATKSAHRADKSGDGAQRSWTRLAARFGGFGAVPVMSSLISLLILPVITRHTDSGGWAAVTVGQSAGGLASIAANYGWMIQGPTRVAESKPNRRYTVWFEALASIAPLLVATNLLCAFVLMPALPAHWWSFGAAVCVATSLSAMSVNWYAVGTGVAWYVLVFDLLPRLAAVVIASAVILAGGSLWAYPAATLLGALVGATAFSLFLRSRHGVAAVSRASVLRSWKANLPAATMNLASSGYSAGALVVVGAVTTPVESAKAGSADKLFRIAIQVIMVLTNSLFAWIFYGAADKRSRLRTSAWLHAGLGVTGLTGFILLGPTASRILFGGHLVAPTVVCAGYGAAFLLGALTSFMARHVLVPHGMVKVAMQSTVGGCVLGVPALAFIAHAYGAPGAGFGIATGEMAVAIWQVGGWLRAQH